MARRRSISGKRPKLNNLFVRSRWEANTAHYLNFLVKQKKILKWTYEPDTFLFEGVLRGPFTYTPDFKVFYPDHFEFWEVKGWLDAKSRGKLKRMNKFYPEVKIVLIDEAAYNAIKQWSHLIPNWEYEERKKK